MAASSRFTACDTVGGVGWGGGWGGGWRVGGGWVVGGCVTRLADRFRRYYSKPQSAGTIHSLALHIGIQWTSCGIDPGTTGSGAGFPQNPGAMSSDGESFMKAYSSTARSPGYTEEALNLSMTAKQPTSYDGKVRWFRCEELADDWTTFTTIEADSLEMLTCTRQSSRATDCKILKSITSRTR